MKNIRSILLAIALSAVAVEGFSQGFVNLDFEDAVVPNRYTLLANPAEIFPGWTVTAPFACYDEISLSGASASIFDTNAPYFMLPIQGNYFAMLLGPGTATVTVSLSQTGQIPLSAKSITFWGDIEGMAVTFNGQPLSFAVQNTTANYNIYGADISAYAGQSGQLTFSETQYGTGKLDNIQFSSTAVPEPSSFALGILGGTLLVFTRKKSNRP
jgi:hypothetical protein